MAFVFRQLKAISLFIILAPSLLVLLYKLMFNKVTKIQENAEILSMNDQWIVTSDTSHESVVLEEELEWNILRIKTKARCSDFPNDELQRSVLTALQHGAKFIYVTSVVDENISSVLDRFEYETFMSAIRYSGNFSNPVTLHFNHLKDARNLNRVASFSYELGVWKTAPVQKLISPSSSIVKHHDNRAPSLVLPFGKIMPFRNDNVMFNYVSFWAIIPFIEDPFIWSLWVQKLLQELGSFASYVTSSVGHGDCGNPVQKLKVIYDDLNNWQCQERKSFFSCVLSLSKFILDKKYIKLKEYRNITSWLEILMTKGYSQPVLAPRGTGLRSLDNVYKVLYHPTVKSPYGPPSSSFKSICPQGLQKCPISITYSPSKLFKNILLVVVFNKAGFYSHIDYIEKVYRPYFKYILYCGQDMGNFLPTYLKLQIPISFIEMQPDFANGQIGYQCIQKAIRMNYDVKGYLHLSDDVLLNMWNLNDVAMSTDHIWFQSSTRTANLSQPTVPDVWRNPNWWPWTSGYGRRALTKALITLRNLSKSNHIAKSFLEQLALNAKGENRVFYEVSDIFYIPQKLSKLFVFHANVFSANNVYLEIAVPTIINGIAEQKDIIRMKGAYLWYGDRKYYRETFNYTHVFQHPIKPGACFPDKTCMTFLCDKYLSCLHN